MDAATSLAPRRISDTLVAVCSHCKQTIYHEKLVADLQPDGHYEHHREVLGSFKQLTDADGTPTGPVIPHCTCQE